MHQPAEPPIPFTTLVELARARAAGHPRRRAFTFLRGGETSDAHLTFGALDAEARRIGALLQQHFAPGDRIVLAYSLGREFIPAFFGCLYAGVVAVLAPPPSGTAEIARLRRIAADSGAIGLATGSARLQPRPPRARVAQPAPPAALPDDDRHRHRDRDRDRLGRAHDRSRRAGLPAVHVGRDRCAAGASPSATATCCTTSG